MNLEDFISLTENRRFAVFGTGFAAEMFYQGLAAHGCENNIDRFYVSREVKSAAFHGIPVSPLSAYSQDMPLLIAVAPSNAADIEEFCENSVNIYPFLTEYLYGIPVSRKCLLRVSDILAKQPADEYWVAARYAGIDGVMKNDDQLTDLYVRCISLHAERSTALRRLDRLRSLCAEISAHGFDNSNSPIAIDRSGRIIDGLHRIAAAVYFGAKSLYCDIYPKSELFDKILTDRNRLPEQTLIASGFNPSDIGKLKEYRTILDRL